MKGEHSAAVGPASTESGALHIPSLVQEGSEPGLRHYFGHLLSVASEADFAIGRVRLAGIDFCRSELNTVGKCRLLLGRLDAESLSTTGTAGVRENLQHLLEFVCSGRITIHSAGMQHWWPDFSVFRSVGGLAEVAAPDIVVLGAHHFARSQLAGGSALSAIIDDVEAARIAGRCFDDLFNAGYDVTSVVQELLHDLVSRAPLNSDVT
jgi:hypothetical protein